MESVTVTVDRRLFTALRKFDAERLRYLDEAAAAGPFTRLRYGPVSTWVLTDAEIARNMLIANGSDWERPPAAVVPIRLGVGENLFTQSEEDWSRIAPIVSPAFRRRALDERLAAMEPIVTAGVNAIGHGTAIDVELHMGAIALQLAAWVLFGETLPLERSLELASAQRNVVNWVGTRMGQIRSVVPFTIGSSARTMRANRAVLDMYAGEVIEHARKRNDPGDDTIGLLLAARPGGSPLSATALREHVLGLLLAGNETTAAALAWACVNAAENPSEWEKLRADPTRSRAYVDETLRLTPAVWAIPRRPARRGVRIGDQPIRRSELVTIYLRGINRDARIWKDPLVFRPERHLVRSEADASLIPFGLGSRGCIGQHLAMAEMIATLPILAAHGDISIDGPVEPDPRFALRITGGLRASWSAPTTTAVHAEGHELTDRLVKNRHQAQAHDAQAANDKQCLDPLGGVGRPSAQRCPSE
jgi:cytochrome P450